MNWRRLAIAVGIGAAMGLVIYVLGVFVLVMHSVLSLAFLAAFVGIGIGMAAAYDLLGPTE